MGKFSIVIIMSGSDSSLFAGKAGWLLVAGAAGNDEARIFIMEAGEFVGALAAPISSPSSLLDGLEG